MNGKVILEHFYLLQKKRRRKKDDEISSLWKSHFKLGQLITGKIGLHCLAAVMPNNINLIHWFIFWFRVWTSEFSPDQPAL